MIDFSRIRAEFPIFAANPRMVYLDSAATSQRPEEVIGAVAGFYRRYNANVARGLYEIAEEATLAYEAVRKKAGRFISSKDEGEIVFTKNTTESANVLMRGFGEKFIKKGDRIVATLMDHHSNFVPWQQLALMKGARFEVAGLNPDGTLDLEDLGRKLKGAKLFAFPAASNVLGTLNDSRGLCAMARDSGAVSIVDGAQSVPSMPTDVKKMGCDFLMFSGHKMLAPFGSGVLYGRRELLEKMDPFLYGSAMIRSVGMKESEWNDVPHRFEAGTPLVDAVIGLGAAIDYLNRIGMGAVRDHEEALVARMLKRLGEVRGLRVLGPCNERKRAGLVSFSMDGIHPHDVSAMLAEDGVCVRSGHHCAMPLHAHLDIPASTRASVYIYNGMDDIDALAASLEKVRKVFG
ncbi:SufS family cysteine desulfurase [Candidatus Micrarchaeota archaeon]|nr:SufS family cysteine desulfurase [Candidatus Micrarchaeota archaeon]